LEDYLGCERLLVVDDMADQRTITASMLRKLGYQVETASSGEEAIGLAVRQELARVCKDRPVENGLGLSCAGGQRPALPEGRQFPTDDVI
jgi:CheY-like chemotaxis protein